jgi:hypothetical protein
LAPYSGSDDDIYPTQTSHRRAIIQSLYQSAKSEGSHPHRLAEFLYLNAVFHPGFPIPNPRIVAVGSAEPNNGPHMSGCGPDDWRERRIRERLLLILRLAITREPRDRFAVYAMADGLDTN